MAEVVGGAKIRVPLLADGQLSAPAMQTKLKPTGGAEQKKVTREEFLRAQAKKKEALPLKELRCALQQATAQK